jgi:hypothetical protein
MQPALLRYCGNAIKLIVTQHTQQELLRYYGNLICHNIMEAVGHCVISGEAGLRGLLLAATGCLKISLCHWYFCV